VVVLAETAEMAAEIDEHRAQMDVQAKGQKLKGQKLSEEDMDRIRASMLKEMVRMKVAEKSRKR
jgi:F0F1-type ATP synthase epsilon subunit